MNTPKDGFDIVHGKTGNGGTKLVSFALIFMDNIPKKTVQLSELSNEESGEGADVAIPLAAVDEATMEKPLPLATFPSPNTLPKSKETHPLNIEALEKGITMERVKLLFSLRSNPKSYISNAGITTWLGVTQGHNPT
ncbi:hypothetical protein Tco_1181884 [Tanacetum coccineum]